jgi:hypothetical protein
MKTEQKSTTAEKLNQNELFRQLRGPSIGVPLLQLVMDYAPGDMAVGEIAQELCKYLPRNWQMHFSGVHSFKTTETGFLVGQYALGPRVPEDPQLILYVNCAPRKDRRDARRDNEGEGFVYGKLTNGVQVAAVNSGYSLSLLREHFTALHIVDVSRQGSQFRSRDNFPKFVCALAQGLDVSSMLGKELDPHAIIPEFKEGYIGYIDSFGNIKTTFRKSSSALHTLKPGQLIQVEINGTEIVAQVATGSFNVPEGNFAFSIGSSGWDDRFWEVFQRGGDAARAFHNPQVGAEVKLTPLK